ncbi:MAG: ATP-binding protein [Bacteroidetes bacterium]|nr:ATP-binding protein [Bacteroidota bacterium]
MDLSRYIKNLIRQGEYQQLDFKFEIADAKKIARTFSAFANTTGGTLLIGVKDNGVIVGIKTDEEIYMAEAAADLYCQPKVSYTGHNWKIDGKWVLELKIPKSEHGPHLAPWKNKKMAFIRIGDENHLANSVIYKVLLQKRHQNNGVLVKYLNEEEFLLNYLKQHEFITLSAFTKLMNVTRYKAERILVNLISVGILTYSRIENTYVYMLNQ